MLVVRDISEASRRGSLAGCSPLAVAVSWPSSLPGGQCRHTAQKDGESSRVIALPQQMLCLVPWQFSAKPSRG